MTLIEIVIICMFYLKVQHRGPSLLQRLSKTKVIIIIWLPVAKPDASLGSQVLHSVSKRAYAGRVTQEAVCNLFSLLRG